MKKIKLTIIVLVISSVFMLTSCLQFLQALASTTAANSSTLIYFDSVTYTTFRNESKITEPFEDGSFMRAEINLNNSSPNQNTGVSISTGGVSMSQAKKISDIRHESSEYHTISSLSKYMENCGLSSQVAQENAKWLFSVNHGIVIIRNGQSCIYIFR